MAKGTSRIRNSLSFFVMLYCIFSFTIGQYIPIYFIDNDSKSIYYFILMIVTVITVCITVFRFLYRVKKENKSSAYFFSAIVGGLAFLFFGILTFGHFLTGWSEGRVYYVKRTDPKVKIVSRYVNEGAFGGGTEPSDYHIVLHRPFLSYFKIETSIDTTKIDKADWIMP